MGIQDRTVRRTNRPGLGRKAGLLGLAMALAMLVSLASASFALAATSPAVSHLSRSSGPTTGGATVTITGKNFMVGGKSVVKRVMFGGSIGTKLQVKSATRLTVMSPRHAVGMVQVRVRSTSGKQSAIVKADRFTFKRPVPLITGLDPATGSTVGGNTVTITGKYFTGATAVMFGAVAATSFTVVSSTSITAVAPVEPVGTIEVTVKTLGGLTAPNTTNQYAYVDPPAVTALSPATGPAAGGTSVTITGTSLSGATAVMFGAVAATDVTVVSATSITCTAPPEAAGTVAVTVTTPFGMSPTSSVDQYIYTP